MLSVGVAEQLGRALGGELHADRVAPTVSVPKRLEPDAQNLEIDGELIDAEGGSGEEVRRRIGLSDVRLVVVRFADVLAGRFAARSSFDVIAVRGHRFNPRNRFEAVHAAQACQLSP